MENPNSEIIYRASELERSSQEIQQSLSMIESQISELEKFRENLEYLSKSDKKETFSSLGRGVYVKTTLSDEKLLVDVGSGVLVKKTSEKTSEIILSQIKKFKDAKISLQGQLELINSELAKLIEEFTESKSKTSS
jgi:prefoldin alpha subunit